MAKIRFKDPSPAIAQVISGICSTLNFRVSHDSSYAHVSARPFIFSFWHESIFVMPYVYHHTFGGKTCVVLTSASKDGEIIARTCNRFGLEACRGSSSKRGAQALIELIKFTRREYSVVVTPDGPRGPSRELGLGLLKLAQLSGLEIVPVQIHLDAHWKLNTWDQFQVPKPFSAGSVHFAAPIAIPRDADANTLEMLRQHVINEMSR